MMVNFVIILRLICATDMMEKVAVRYGTEYCAAAEKGEGATVINVIDY